jgi:hypothetical protein
MPSPKWKVYTAAGEYIASCKEAEDAAVLVSVRGNGSTIRYEHKHTVWTEGAEMQPAGESYDYVANTAHERINAIIVGNARKRRAAADAFAASARKPAMYKFDGTLTDKYPWED